MEQETTKKMYDCIVIGGGISGVSFAYYLAKQQQSVLILEKESKLGGRIHSITPNEDTTYWSELGAHTCYNSYTELISLIKESGNEKNIVPMQSLPYLLYSRQKIRSVVSEMNIFSMGFNCWKYFFSDKKGKTTRSYFEPIVGKLNYNKLFSKLFRAVISQEADEYPAEIFLKKRATKDESVSRKFSYQGGLSQMIEDVADASNADIITASQVVGIEKNEEGIFCIKTCTGANYFARKIAIATDISETPRLLSEIGLEEPSKILQSIRPSESIAINLRIDKDKLSLKKVAGIIPLSDAFFSAVSRDTIEDENWRSFTFHFPESHLSPAERLETIFSVLQIKDEEASRTEIYRHTLPAVRLEHLNLKEKLAKMLHETDISILGNYFLGMSLEDCVRHSKEEAKIF